MKMSVSDGLILRFEELEPRISTLLYYPGQFSITGCSLSLYKESFAEWVSAFLLSLAVLLAFV